LGGPGCGDGVLGVGLALASPALAVGPVDFDDGDALLVQVPREPRPIAAGALDADELDGPEALEEAQELPIARRRRGLG